MAYSTKGIFIVAAKRTPFGSYGGSLRNTPASHIYAAAAKDALISAQLDPKYVDTTVVGNVNFLSQCDGGKTPRYCGIYSGVPLDKPALGVNMACGSGLQSIINGAQDILTGAAKISLTGGTEIMSDLPFLVRNMRFGTQLGSSHEFQEYISKQALDSYCGLTAAEIAEDLARKYNITRSDADLFALQSHLKWKTACDSGIFGDEITPLTVKVKNKDVVFERDEVPNANITIDELSRLPGNIVTEGNSSMPADGAAALVLASEEAARARGLRPRARAAGWARAGPGASAALRRLLADAGLGAGDVGLFEINETFTAQTLACIKELNIDQGKVNVNGGAVAMGHAAGATGARMATHLVHEMRRRNIKRAIAACSVGGRQGIALLIESI